MLFCPGTRVGAPHLKMIIYITITSHTAINERAETRTQVSCGVVQ